MLFCLTKRLAKQLPRKPTVAVRDLRGAQYVLLVATKWSHVRESRHAQLVAISRNITNVTSDAWCPRLRARAEQVRNALQVSGYVLLAGSVDDPHEAGEEGNEPEVRSGGRQKSWLDLASPTPDSTRSQNQMAGPKRDGLSVNTGGQIERSALRCCQPPDEQNMRCRK